MVVEPEVFVGDESRGSLETLRKMAESLPYRDVVTVSHTCCITEKTFSTTVVGNNSRKDVFAKVLVRKLVRFRRAAGLF